MTALTLLAIGTSLAYAQYTPRPRISSTGTGIGWSTDLETALHKTIEKQIVQAQKGFQLNELQEITSKEGIYLLRICKRMRNIIANHASSKKDIEYLRNLQNPQDKDGKLVRVLAQNYLTVLEIDTPAHEKEILFRFLDSSLQVQFQPTPYTMNRDVFYQYLSRTMAVDFRVH